MQGIIYDSRRKPEQPNVIICVSSRSGISEVNEGNTSFPLSFPTQGSRQELPLVSVITPAYNREALLDGVIRSVLDQDYPNVEYIVLDDGSTDGTLNVIKRHEGKIRWETHENVGEARTVNKGLGMAKGEIVGVVNSDDPLLPGAISTLVTYLLAHPDVLVAYPDWVVIDDDGETIQRIATYEYDYANMIRWHHCMPGPGTFFRRAVIEKLGGRDPNFRFVGDFDFWLRAGLLGSFARVPATLATFRYHPESYSTSQLGRAMADEHIRLADKLFAAPNLPPEVRKIKREAYSSAYYIAGTQCGDGAPSLAKRRYFLRALWYAPYKYLGEYRRRLRMMLPALLGRFYEPLRRVARPVYRRLHTVRQRLSTRRA
jgi:glycosyltransferase involved in cell wall biosynthesis